MDAKKLIEGLPIENLSHDSVTVSGYVIGRKEVQRNAQRDHGIKPLGWRVLLALMDEQEPEWKLGDRAEVLKGSRKGHSFKVREVSGGEPFLRDDTREPPDWFNASVCRHVAVPKQPKPDLSGPAWDTVEFYAKQGNAAYRCILILRDYLLAREKP